MTTLVREAALATDPVRCALWIQCSIKTLVDRVIHSTAVVVLAALPAQAQVTKPTADGLVPTAAWTANTRGNARTPPMGWSSWNAFETAIDEEKVLGTAKALVDTGLARLGYRYVNIDDGWWHKRRLSDGRMQVRTDAFPSAQVGGAEGTSFRPLVDQLHNLGLKAGIYSDIGHNSCSQAYTTPAEHLPVGTVKEREIGLAGHVEQDIDLYFRQWGFDYIKVDACGIDETSQQAWRRRGADHIAYPPLIVRDSVNRSKPREVQLAYQAVADAIAKAKPDGDYVLSICAWGAANVRAWGKDVGNAVRTSNDIRPNWSRMLHTLDSAATRPLYAQPGAWNDPDMLFIGHGDFDARHLVEARSHFSLWAMLNAPLLVGFDLRSAPRELLDILSNEALIQANQDAGGHQAVMTYDSEDVQIFVKTLAGVSRKVVAVFNRGSEASEVKLMPEHLRFDRKQPIALRNLWTNEKLELQAGDRVLQIAPRETLVFEATGARALPNGYYVTELPGRVNVARDGVVTPQADPRIHRGIDPWASTSSGGSRPVYAGWGGAAADQTPYGQTITLAGSEHEIGVGILANSRLEFRNEGEFSDFTALVGVDDNSLNPTAAVEFSVFADGRLVARSPVLKLGDKPHALRAPIRSARIVELVVRQRDDVKRPAAVAWASAAVLR